MSTEAFVKEEVYGPQNRENSLILVPMWVCQWLSWVSLPNFHIVECLQCITNILSSVFKLDVSYSGLLQLVFFKINLWKDKWKC